MNQRLYLSAKVTQFEFNQLLNRAEKAETLLAEAVDYLNGLEREPWCHQCGEERPTYKVGSETCIDYSNPLKHDDDCPLQAFLKRAGSTE